MDIESDGSERWEDFFGSSTDLAPSLLGYYDSLAATKVSDEPQETRLSSSTFYVSNHSLNSVNTTTSTTGGKEQSPPTAVTSPKVLEEQSFQASIQKFRSVCHSSARPTRPAPQLPKFGEKFRNLSSNVQRILSNTDSAADVPLTRPPAPFHRNGLQSASFSTSRSISLNSSITTASVRHTPKNLPLSKNIAKFTRASTGSSDTNGNVTEVTSVEDDAEPKFSSIQQRIKSLTSALFDDLEPPDPAKPEPQPPEEEPVLRNPQKSMDATEPQDAFVENCDDAQQRYTIVETRNPHVTLVVPKTPPRLGRSPKLPRTPSSTSTSTRSLDTTSSASLSSSKTSLTQTPGTPILSTRPLSASSISSYSSSSSSGSDHLHLAGGITRGIPTVYTASVESLADPSECEQGGGSGVGVPSGLTMCERAVMEIVDSERSYVEDLGQIIKGYLQDWKERACLRVDELEVLFSNIQEVWDFNSRLLSSLNETKGDPVLISGCFIDLHEDFDCYTTYCTRYPEAIALLTSLLQATHTNALLIHTQKMLNHNLPLGSYLLKPVQRILKYHLLLDNLRKHCDDKQVAHAHELMKNVAHNIDQVKKKLEQQSRVKELAGIVDGWLGPDLSVLGELRQEGLLSEHAKPRVVLLFQTMLIITKPKEDKRLQFRAYIPCKNLMLVEHLPGEPTSFNVIPYNDPKGQIKLTARNRDQKRLWSQQIKQAMLEHFDIPKRAKDLVLQLGDEDDKNPSTGAASWKWPGHHASSSTPDYLERRQQFRRSEMRMRSKKQRKNTIASSISLDGISQKDLKQPTFQSYSKDLEKKEGDGVSCKCDVVKKELEQKQTALSRSRSETRDSGRSDEEIFAKAMHERSRFATQGRRKTKESFVDVKSYNTTTIPKRIATIRKSRSKTLTGNSTFYTDLEGGAEDDTTTVLKIVESTDNLSIVDGGVSGEKEEVGRELGEETPRRDSDIISQLVLEKNEFRKKSSKKKSFDSRSLSCASQDEDGDHREDEVPELPRTEPPADDEEEAEFRKVDELNKKSEDLLNRLSEIQSDLPSPEPIYESLLRNVHVPYKYAPPLTRSVSQQYGKPGNSPKKNRPESDYVTLAYSENGLVNIEADCVVVPKSAVAQLRNSDTNINYHHHHQPWNRPGEDAGTVQDTQSEIVHLDEGLKPALLERQGSLSIKSPKNLLQRFISLHSSPAPSGSCDSALHQRKISCPDESTTIHITSSPTIYKQGSLDLGSRIANLDYADPRTLFPQPANIFINRGSLKSADPEQRDSIFSLTSSSDSVCQGGGVDLDDDPNGFYEKSVEECLECEDFRDSAVYSGDDNRPDADDQVVYASIEEVTQQQHQKHLLQPPTSVARSSSSASSSSNGAGPPPIPVKPAHLEGRRVAVKIEGPKQSEPPSKGWVLQQVKRFQ
uniref:Pleckstrin homology domain-containing family G member 1 n=1 Tax=Culex pipiens TaxID=7175 RepID=A0A8D8ADG5_CULPI